MPALSSRTAVSARGWHRCLTRALHELHPIRPPAWRQGHVCLFSDAKPGSCRAKGASRIPTQMGLTPRKCSWMIISFLITTLSSFQVSNFKCISFKINYFYLFLLLLLVIPPALTGQACSISRMMSAFVHIFFLSSICTSPLCHMTTHSSILA